MMRVLFSDGMNENINLFVDDYFNMVFERDWFDDPIVHQMVKDIDDSVVLAGCCIDSPYLGVISPMELSGGVKGLILLYKTDDFYTDMIIFGENCEKWLSWLSDHKDFDIEMSGYDLVFKDGIHAICRNDNSEINGYRDWVLKMVTDWRS